MDFLHEFTVAREDEPVGVDLGTCMHLIPFLDVPPVSPEPIYDALYKRLDTQKGRQEDAQEFLGFLLDGLEEELLSVVEGGSEDSVKKEDGGEWMEMGPKKRTVLTRKVHFESTDLFRRTHETLPFQDYSQERCARS